jgi:hypothetical protein
MLRREPLPIDNGPRHLIPKFVAQRIQNHLEGASTIVRTEVPHIFQEEGAGTLGGDDPGNVEEKRALRGAFEPMRPAQRSFLADAGNAEWLAREPAKQDVVVGEIVSRTLGDVPDERMMVTVVLDVGLPAEPVPLTREHTPATHRLEAEAQPTNARKQVNEGEWWFYRCG